MAVVRLETGDHQPENGFVSSETTSSGLLSRIDGYVFPCLGGFGKYQRQLIVLTCIPVLFIGFSQFSDDFLLAQPDNKCGPPIAKFENITASSLLPANNTNSSSQSLDASSTENNSSTNCLCLEGNYKTETGLVRNVVTKWNLVCTSEWMVHIAKFSLLVGSIFGYLVLGVLADWFGRRPVLITSVLFMVVFGLTVAFSINVTMFSTLRFFEGFCLAGITLSLYVLRIELCLPLWRFRITMVANFVVLAGQLLMPGLAALCKDWQVLQAIIICPFILMVSYIWIFPESLRWLLSTQQYCRARRQMLRITRKNRVHEADVDEIFSELQNESQKKPKRTCIVKMVGTRNLWKNIVVLCVNSLTGYGIHHCFARSMIDPVAGETSMFHNFHADYYTMAGIAVASCLALCPAVGFMGRRGGLLMFMIITALASLLQLGLLNLLGKYSFKLNIEQEQSETLNKKFSIAFSIIGMFSSHAVSNLSIFFCAEITPTVIRGGGLGLVLASAGFGMLTAPIMELHNQKGYFLHHVIFACCTLICIICILLLPETRYKSLPEHIGDGEACVRPPLLPPKKPGEQDPLLNQLDPSDRPPVQETALVGDGEINGPPHCGEDSAQSPPPCVIEVTSICTTVAPPSFELDSACPVDMDAVQPERTDEYAPSSTDSALAGATDTTSPSQPCSANTTPTTPPCSTDTATTPPCNADTTPTTPLCGTDTATTPPCSANTTPTTPPSSTDTAATPPCTADTTPTAPLCGTDTATTPPYTENTMPTTPHCTTNATPTTQPCITNTTPTTPPCAINSTPATPPCTANTTPTTQPCTINTTPTTPPCAVNSTLTTPPCDTDTPFSPCSQDTTSAAPLLQSSGSDSATPCAPDVASPVCSEVPSTSTEGTTDPSAVHLKPSSPTDTASSNAAVCKSPISTEPTSPNATDPKSPSCTDPKSPNVSDPKPPSSMDPTSPSATDPKSPNCTDLKPPNATDPESPNAIDPESPIGTDPKSPSSTDPKSPNSTDPKSPYSTDSKSPKAIDPISPRPTDLISPSAMNTESSYATDPKSVITIDPKFSSATNPISTKPTDLKSASATDPTCLCAVDPEISSPKDFKSPHASDSESPTATDLKSPSATDPKSPNATDLKSPSATDPKSPCAIDFLSLDPGDFKSPITTCHESPTAEESGSSVSIGPKSPSAMDCLCPSAVDVLSPGATDLPAARVVEAESASPSTDTTAPPTAGITAPGPSSDSTPPPANSTATTDATPPSSGSGSAPTSGEGGAVPANEAANGVPSS